jgi:glycosyltransferase involved in cell wall biosynthesis
MVSVQHVLVHRGTPWQTAVNCSTNIYAGLLLERGFTVSYAQGMHHLEHRLLRRGEHYASVQAGPRNDRGAWVLTPVSLLPGRPLSNSPKLAAARYRACWPSIAQLLARSGAPPPDWIFTARPGSSALADLFPRARLAFQVVDYYPAFMGKGVQRLEHTDYRRADHVFTIGRRLFDHVVNNLGVDARKVTNLGQGVATQLYQQSWKEPPELATVPRPRAVWVGVCAKGDPALFAAAARALGEHGGALVLIGPGAPWVDDLRKTARNVHFFGPRPASEVPAWLSHADVGLMFYDQRDAGRYVGQNPLKLYEYAAAGLAILSTPHAEYRDLRPPVAVVESPEQVGGALRAVLEEPEALRADALAFAARHDWNRDLDRIVDVFQSLSA